MDVINVYDNIVIENKNIRHNMYINLLVIKASSQNFEPNSGHEDGSRSFQAATNSCLTHIMTHAHMNTRYCAFTVRLLNVLCSDV